MSEITKAKIAYADAIITAMWARGLLTDSEQEKLKDRTAASLQGKC